MRLHSGWAWITALACLFTAGACGSGGEEDEARSGLRFIGSASETPLQVDFGAVSTAAISVERRVVLVNDGPDRVRVVPPVLELPFRLAPAEPFVLEGRGQRELVLTFVTSAPGSWNVEARLRHDRGELPFWLIGKAVAPQVRCTPAALDLGGVEPGQQATAEVLCTNESSLAAPLTGAIGGDDADRFSFHLAADLEIPPQATVRIPVTFRGDAAPPGPRTARLTLRTGATTLPAIELRATSIASAIEGPAGCIEFGYVQPGLRAARQVVIRNSGGQPLAIREAGVVRGPYRVVGEVPALLPPDDPATADVRENEVAIEVEYAPEATGRHDGALQVHSGSVSRPVLEIPLCGFGGGPLLSCAAASIDFGPAAVGVPRTRSLLCTNAGNDDPSTVLDNLVLESVGTDLELFSARVVNEDGSTGPQRGGYAAGESFRVEVTYAPEAETTDVGSLSVRSNDGLAPEQHIPLRGSGRVLAACSLGLSQEAIDFALVGPGRSLELALGVRNRGTEDCLIYDVEAITTGGLEAFSARLDGGTAIVPGGGKLVLPVTFTGPTLRGAATEQQVAGSLRFGVSDPAQPIRTVPVRATVRAHCLVTAPGPVDLGTGQPGCAPREREVRISNGCAAPIEVVAIEAAEGASCDGTSCPFTVRSAMIETSLTLRPGEAHSFEVAYQPQALGEDRGVARVEVGGMTEPHLIALQGSSPEIPTRSDTFVQAPPPKVDVLWVIDNTTSNSSEHFSIAQNLSSFLAAAEAGSVDFQLGVTSTDTRIGDDNPDRHGGRLVPVLGPRSDRILTAAMPDLIARWTANVLIGEGGEILEKGILAARMALSPGMIDVADYAGTTTPNDGNWGFMRPDAALAVVIASDSADHDPTPVADHLDFFRGLKGYERSDLVEVHGIIGDPDGSCLSADGAGVRYHQLIEGTGGVWESWCTRDWSATMAAIGDGVFGDLGTRYGLTNTPACAGSCEDSIAVRVGGASIPAGAGAARRWSYDAAANRIVFAPGHRPTAGTTVEITYEAACN